MRFPPTLCCVALAAWWLCGAISALAGTYYVSASGLNSNAGTEASPWKTIGRAVSAGLRPGDTVVVRGGVYSEFVRVTASGSAAGGRITFKNYPGEVPILDGTTLTVPPEQDSGAFLLSGVSYVTIQGFEIRNYTTTDPLASPVGIHMTGVVRNIDIRNNHIHHIQNNDPTGEVTAHGIAVYGSTATSCRDIIIDGNHLHDLVTGWSEALVLNGNVERFEVTNNTVHDCNNIGIDFIGWEGTAPAAVDQVRDGVCRGNTVYNITSTTNPAYGAGNYAAGGIYCDGATRVVIEQNRVHHCDIGIELASEHQGKSTSFITVRCNFIYENTTGGIYLGGYNSRKGTSENCTVEFNSFWNNDAFGWDGSAEVVFQYYVMNCSFQHNVFHSGAYNRQMVVLGTGCTGNVMDWNLWYCPGGAGAAYYEWEGAGALGLAAWRAARGLEVNSKFGNPKFTSTGTTVDLHLLPTSPAVDACNPARVVVAGELDFDSRWRVTGLRADLGADELPPYLAWKAATFGAANTGAATAADNADPDKDGSVNVMEYAMGSGALSAAAKSGLTQGVVLLSGKRYATFTYPVSAAAKDATFVVEASTDLKTWVAEPVVETGRVVSGGVTVVTVRGSQPLGLDRFYRLRAQVSP